MDSDDKDDSNGTVKIEVTNILVNLTDTKSHIDEDYINYSSSQAIAEEYIKEKIKYSVDAEDISDIEGNKDDKEKSGDGGKTEKETNEGVMNLDGTGNNESAEKADGIRKLDKPGTSDELEAELCYIER